MVVPVLVAVQVGEVIGIEICAPDESSADVKVVLGMVAVMGAEAGLASVASIVNCTVPDTVAFPLAVAIDTKEPAIVKFKPKLFKL